LHRATFDFDFANAGIEIGPWRKPLPPLNSRRSRLAAGEVDGRTAILRAGDQHFQPQPRPRAATTTLERISTTTNQMMDRYPLAGSAAQR
jgi:hypothetical protein